MKINLTFAELAFLLTKPGASRVVLDRLSIQLAEDRDSVFAAGAASLITRELLWGNGDVAVPSFELIPLIDALAFPVSWVDMALARGGEAGAVRIFEDSATRIVVKRGNFGVIECIETDRDESLGSVSSGVIGRFLSNEPGDVLVVSAARLDSAPLALRKLPSGEVRVSSQQSSKPTSRSHFVLSDALDEVATYVDT